MWRQILSSNVLFRQIHLHTKSNFRLNFKLKIKSRFVCLFSVHTMCTDNSPIRNTLYGYIVSPGYPHPTADNLTCSINIGKMTKSIEKKMFFSVS